jgi:hypothetical protein
MLYLYISGLICGSTLLFSACGVGRKIWVLLLPLQPLLLLPF